MTPKDPAPKLPSKPTDGTALGLDGIWRTNGPVTTGLPRAVPDAFVSLPAPRAGSTRQLEIAVLVEHGVHHDSFVALCNALVDSGAVVHFVGCRIGRFVTDAAATIESNHTLERATASLFDTTIIPDGPDAVASLVANPYTRGFVQELFKRWKTLLALGCGRRLLIAAGIHPTLHDHDGVLFAECSETASIVPGLLNAIEASRLRSDHRALPST